MKLTSHQHTVLEKMNSGASLWRSFQSRACWLETPDGRERVPFNTVDVLVKRDLVKEHAGDFLTFYDLTDAGRALGEAYKKDMEDFQ